MGCPVLQVPNIPKITCISEVVHYPVFGTDKIVKQQTQYFCLSNLTNLMHKILFYNKFISWLYMFRAHVLIVRRSKLHYTVSGIIHTYRCARNMKRHEINLL